MNDLKNSNNNFLYRCLELIKNFIANNYMKPWFTIFMIIYIYPIGICLMWYFNHFSKTTRVIISFLFLLITLTILILHIIFNA